MSDNNVTAKEAYEAAKNSNFDGVEYALKSINSKISILMRHGAMSIREFLLKEDLGSDGLKVVIADLESRGFKVKHKVGDATYTLIVAWDQ